MLSVFAMSLINLIMFDFLYHMTLILFCNRVFGLKTSTFCQIYTTLLWASFYVFFTKICKPLVVYRFYCMAL